jgi:type IV secretory pathway TraG/TraD family ATPase VirD4
MKTRLQALADQLSLKQRLNLLWKTIRAFPVLRAWPVKVDGIPIGKLADTPAFLPIEGHSITIGAPGEGKFTSVIAPLALHDVRDEEGRSCGMVFLDVKNGEAARITRPYRETLREEMTFVLDPYGLAGGTDTVNPFEFIDPTAADFFEQCAGLAKALIVQRPKDKRGNDFIWDARGADWLTTIIGYLAWQWDEERTIMRVRQFFRLDADGLAAILNTMASLPDAPPFIADGAKDIHRVITKAEREASGYLATILEATQFVDSALMARTLKTSTFDPMVVRSHGASVYIVTPGEQLQISSPWVRLISEVIRQRVLRSHARRQVHWVIDEAKAFDAWNFIEDGLRALRSANISLHLFYQNVGQLKAVWGEGWSSLTDVKLIRFLGSSDVETCKWIAELTGETTVVEYSRADNRGRSTNRAIGTSVSNGVSNARAFGDAQSWSSQKGTSKALATSQARGVSEGKTRQTGFGTTSSDATATGFSFGSSRSRTVSNSWQHGHADGRTSGMSAGFANGPGGSSGNFNSSFGDSHTENFSFGSSISQGESWNDSHSLTHTKSKGRSFNSGESDARTTSTTDTSGVTTTENDSSGQGGSTTTTKTKTETQSHGRTETDSEGHNEGVTITQTERRRLMTVDEVRRLDKAKMIVFVDRRHAHLVDRMHYHRSAPLLARVLEGDLVQRERMGMTED